MRIVLALKACSFIGLRVYLFNYKRSRGTNETHKRILFNSDPFIEVRLMATLQMVMHAFRSAQVDRCLCKLHQTELSERKLQNDY